MRPDDMFGTAVSNPFAVDDGMAGEATTRLRPVTPDEQRERAEAEAKQFLRASRLYAKLSREQADESARGSYARLSESFRSRAVLLIAGFGFSVDDAGHADDEPGDADFAGMFGPGEQYSATTMFGP